MSLAFSAVSKGFPGVLALQDVSFEVRPGSVHALCGENGAGKSTLLKILSGVYQADHGSISIEEEPLPLHNPAAAIRAGIAVIYQELHLIPEMTVAENILLGHFPERAGLLMRSELNRRALEILKTFGVDIKPGRRVGTLPLAQRQMVEIGKALSRDARVIAFDEPTSALSSREVETLFRIIEELRIRGKTILYVSHRMDEIRRICDAATVLRDGRHVETFPSLQGVSSGTLVQRMVGRPIEDIWGYQPRAFGEVVLSARDIEGPGLAGPQNVDVRSGEIVGVFGLVGAGRSELLNAIYGASKRRGAVHTGGVALKGSPKSAIARGLVLCPEDRKKEGIFAHRSVKENVNVSARRRHAYGRAIVRERWETANAQEQVDRLQIRTPRLSQPIALLSGGNQQKAILGRWLSEAVRVIMLDEPTRGIDVGAKREIYEILYDLAENGVGVLFVSSELPEVLGISDRVLIMREGRIVAELDRSEATAERALALALPTGREQI